MRRAPALCALGLLVAGCGGDDSKPAAGADGLAIQRCDEDAHAPVDGPLADDEQVAAAQQERADLGLASDEAATRAALADPPPPQTDAELMDLASAFGAVSAGEFPSVVERYHAAEAAADDARPLVRDRPETAVLAIDAAAGQVVVYSAGDVDATQAELDDAIGAGRARVEAVPAGQVELGALQDAVGDHLRAAGLRSFSVGGLGDGGVVEIGLEVLDPAVVADLAAAFGGDLDLLCVSEGEFADD